MPRKSGLSLLECFAYYTECQAATVEGLKLRKKVAKCELERHESILKDMLDTLREFGVTKETVRGNPRVREILFPDTWQNP